MVELDEHCAAGLRQLELDGLQRSLRATARVRNSGVVVEHDGRRYVSFACNDYLGLRRHPMVTGSGTLTAAKFGAGAGASRLVTGNHPFYAPLEEKLAAMKGTEAALVFGSGYLTNLGVITALMNKGDVIFADKLVHACIIDAAQLSGARLIRFAHNDMAHLEALLKEHREESPNALIVTDHVFSMDGDVAPLMQIAALAQTYECWTMADDAHGLGIVNSRVAIDIWMGTLSKSVGVYGGYVCGSRVLIDFLINNARSLIFSTGLPPAICASAVAGLEVISAEPQRGERVLQLAREVTHALGLPPAQSAIVPVIMGTPEAAIAASEKLKQRRILAVAIRPPTVPKGTARLRLAFSYEHTNEHVAALISALRKIL